MISITRFLTVSAVLGTAIVMIGGCSGPSATNNSTGGESTNVAPEPQTFTVPDALKTDAYSYYGLEDLSEHKVRMKQGTAEPKEGTFQYKLIAASDDVAEYTGTYSGGLSEMGVIKVRLENGGVKVTDAPNTKPSADSWELPIGLIAGKVWDTNSETAEGKLFSIKSTNKVIGTGTVTTPVATYKDALIIVSSANVTNGTMKFTMTSKAWFVKGRGNVKLELEQKTATGIAKSTLEEIK